MAVRIIAQKGSHILVARGDRCAIVERRNNRLYSCHGVERTGIAADRLSSVDQIIDETDWLDEDAGWTMFNNVTSFGTHLAEHMR